MHPPTQQEKKDLLFLGIFNAVPCCVLRVPLAFVGLPMCCRCQVIQQQPEILQTFGRKFRHPTLWDSSLVFRMTSLRMDEMAIEQKFIFLFNCLMLLLLLVILRNEGSPVVL